MNTLQIIAKPTPDSPLTNITLNLNNIEFVFKPPMQDYIISMPGATFHVESVDVEAVKAAGLVEFDTPEGTKGYVNPALALGWTAVQLGVFAIVFPKSRIVVSATTEELERKMSGKPLL